MNNPPLNLMGPQFVVEFREIMSAIENAEQLRVVVFEVPSTGFLLNPSDFNVKLEEVDQHSARAHRSRSPGPTS